MRLCCRTLTDNSFNHPPPPNPKRQELLPSSVLACNVEDRKLNGRANIRCKKAPEPALCPFSTGSCRQKGRRCTCIQKSPNGGKVLIRLLKGFAGMVWTRARLLCSRHQNDISSNSRINHGRSEWSLGLEAIQRQTYESSFLLLFVSWLQSKDYREADLETEGELQILGLEVLETFREI